VDEKIKTILLHRLTVWESMSKEALISELVTENRHFLETELQYGNHEYIDDLLDEVRE
jgi:hypothetical protein